MDPLIESFNARFESIHERSLSLLQLISDADLFRKPRELDRSMAMFSVGEYLLRSAAAVEQTCGGLTTRLWDDPFEWTLPEKLSTTMKVAGYINEVEQHRQRAFRFLTSDEDLKKKLPAPENLQSIFDLLLETISRAEHFQGRAFAVFQMISDEKLPRM